MLVSAHSTLELEAKFQLWKRVKTGFYNSGKNDAFTVIKLVGSLSTRVFETRTATGREHSVCQDSGVYHIFILIIHNREKVLSIVNVMCEDEL